MKRFPWGLLLVIGFCGSFVWAQETKGISWKHGLSFQVRKVGQTVFTKDTPKVGAEVFLDKDIGQLVYISETGSLSLGASAKLTEGAEVKPPLLFHGLEVRVRPVGENSFDKADKINSEVFRDPNAE